jgi:peptidoglycan/xylan/chitin deacetylase (PgdA/CDA1 family)
LNTVMFGDSNNITHSNIRNHSKSDIAFLQAILDRLEETIKFICAALYFIYLNLSNKKPCRVVIYYHSVKRQAVQGFQKQMKYLANRCTVVKPLNIKTARANGTNPVVAITFDDAFVNVMENAVPILKMYNLPAGIFVPTDSLGQPPRWEIPDGWTDKNEIVMSEEQVSKLDKDGFEILSHTVSHPFLTEINDDSVKAELIQSKQILEGIVGHEVAGVSYPHGAKDDKVCEAARNAGYKIGFTIDPRLANGATDSMQIGRFAISPMDSLLKFKLIVSGGYQVEDFLRRLKHLVVKNLPSGVSKNGT